MSLPKQRMWLGLIFVSPWVIGFLIFKFLPIIASFVVSLTDFYALEPQATQFIALENYFHVLRDRDAGGALFFTLGTALTAIPAQLLLALGFATLLNSKRLRAKSLIRSLLFVPTIIPATAIFIVALGFLDPNAGWLNVLILEPLGLPPYAGVFSEAGFNFFLMLLALWAVGPNFLIMLGAMQSIPADLYEAARVDGAGPVYRFVKITVPLISPAIFFSLIVSLITVFGGAALLDQGASFGDGTSAYDAYISQTIFSLSEYGYAAALAWAFFAVMLIVVIVLFRTSRSWVHYAEGEHL
ncbi:MAG TPA: sugar ABC transporter permease [Anaerolineales bacterium]|nr:sugar ABC transporter permease [Anaerolineales bacterium]